MNDSLFDKKPEIGEKRKGSFGEVWTLVEFRDSHHGLPGVVYESEDGDRRWFTLDAWMQREYVAVP